jgi:hypothetical protein
MNPRNHIRSLHLEIQTLNPAEADIRFHVAVDGAADRPALKGRLVGPRCAYASTVEVAYPLRETPAAEPNRLSMRAVIPEPNLWEPACPFLYEATVELFEHTKRLDSITMTVGLRTIGVSANSFVLNGRGFVPQPMEPAHPTESELAHARERFNTVVLPIRDDARPLWHACDQIGLGVLGRVESQAALQLFDDHPCLLALIVDDDKKLATARADLLRAHVPIGLQIRNDMASGDPPDAHFVVIPPHSSQHFQKWGMPVIELGPNL